MSFFYLKPVEGFAQLHTLEDCVFQRYQYLQNLLNGRDVSYCEYLLEGSALDNAGHFLLGLLTRLSNSPALVQLVNRGEEALFRKRLCSARVNDVRYLSKTILRTTKSLKVQHSYLQTLSLLCRKLIIKHVAEHVFDKGHSSNCASYNLNVHFTQCLPFVRNRSVEIEKGIAQIPCGVWKLFLVQLFKVHSDSKFLNVQSNKLLHADPRWREVVAKLLQNVSLNSNQSCVILKYHEIDHESKKFPLCMQNLHFNLKKNHRLSHNERFRYSLFLKDIGVPLQDALQFWRSEYSKPGGKNTSCTHTWKRDEKKFVYGIRHLYGLEGARKNYKMPNCDLIKCSTSPEGGCAFKHFDDAYLEKLRSKNICNETWKTILVKKNMGLAKDACSLYKRAILSDDQDKNTIYSPVNYYIDVKALNIT